MRHAGAHAACTFRRPARPDRRDRTRGVCLGVIQGRHQATHHDHDASQAPPGHDHKQHHRRTHHHFDNGRAGRLHHLGADRGAALTRRVWGTRRRDLRRRTGWRSRARADREVHDLGLSDRQLQPNLVGRHARPEPRIGRDPVDGRARTYRFDLVGTVIRRQSRRVRRSATGPPGAPSRLLTRACAGGGTQAGMTSSTVADPMPPPAHMLETPMPPPRRASSFTSVTIMRAPVAATG